MTENTGLNMYYMVRSIKGKKKSSTVFYKIFCDKIVDCRLNKPNKMQLDTIQKLHKTLEYFNLKLNLGL